MLRVANALNAARKFIEYQLKRDIGTKVIIDNPGQSVRVISENNTTLVETALLGMKKTLAENGIESSYGKTGGLDVSMSGNSFGFKDIIREVEKARKLAERKTTQVVSSRGENGVTHITLSALDIDALNGTQQKLKYMGIFGRIDYQPNPTLSVSSSEADFTNTVINVYHKC